MEITQIAFFVAVMFVVLAFIILLAWIAKRFMGGGRSSRGKGASLLRRDRRLGLVEAASISPRHKLVLVRRDNTEHLLLIGGATEIVVESRILDGGDQESDAEAREPQFGQSPPATGGGLGLPARGPELPRTTAPAFPPTTYGAATATDYEPSPYKREGSDDVGFRDDTPGYDRRTPSVESGYYAPDEASDPAPVRPSYLSSDTADEDRPSSTYEKYRSSFSAPLAGDDAGSPYSAPEPETAASKDAEEDVEKSRVLSRFLHKDPPE